MKAKKPRPKANKQAIPGYLCFSLNPNGPTRQRASYSNERREEVNNVRKSGACLRCQLLKKPVNMHVYFLHSQEADKISISALEENHVRDASRLRQRIKLSVYGSNIPSLKDLALGGVPVLQYFADGDVQLKFDIPFQWNIDELSTFLAGWLLTSQEASTAASMVDIMSSASLYSTLSAIIRPELAQIFKILVYTTSSLSNTQCRYSDGQFESYDIKVIRYCGGRILQYLESQLRPSQLAKLNRHNLYALFLLLLGTAIASNYFEELPGVGSTAEHDIDHTAESVGAELVRLLLHYIIYIGQHTGLIPSNPGSLTTGGSLLFERRHQPTTREPGNCSPRNHHNDFELEQSKILTGAETDEEAQMGHVVPLKPTTLVDALPFVEQMPWDFELSTLDAVALRLLENSDSVMVADQLLFNQKEIAENQRKDSLGSDPSLNEDRLQTWHHGMSDTDSPMMGISSGLFEVDRDESWPCFNRIPTPSPTVRVNSITNCTTLRGASWSDTGGLITTATLYIQSLARSKDDTHSIVDVQFVNRIPALHPFYLPNSVKPEVRIHAVIILAGFTDLIQAVSRT
ncbi:hypothetical protein BLS_008065 [Venturia inaequalis]|uniref:Uncharacterized protein n=1 Tax=Venturia inaequalis TaxID=5025 RepID=A0A8H3U8H2_VENIN|nr:hypothetical protein BLS_008065 [Venturia inaequalis]